MLVCRQHYSTGVIEVTSESELAYAEDYCGRGFRSAISFCRSSRYVYADNT